MANSYQEEVRQGNRFEFGKNWARYLHKFDESRLAKAICSLQESLEIEHLSGKSFLDIGSGSGLFSLAARKLGARVHSFDFDPHSVACTKSLKDQFYRDDPSWVVESGSALDRQYLESCGRFDVVYSWGVLHHTGAMWAALENASTVVAPQGKLVLAIYNDQEGASRRWLYVKRAYNHSPQWVRGSLLGAAFVKLWGKTLFRDLLLGNPLRTWNKYASQHERGMSPWRDIVDWVGGYPFEVAKPEQVLEFYRKRGFLLVKLKTVCGGHGCNEYVFAKT